MSGASHCREMEVWPVEVTSRLTTGPGLSSSVPACTNTEGLANPPTVMADSLNWYRLQGAKPVTESWVWLVVRQTSSILGPYCLVGSAW